MPIAGHVMLSFRLFRFLHEGTAQVKTRLFETYKREYENFVQKSGKSVDAMFSRFQSIVVTPCFASC